jgi:UDP-glucose 4-epimerase
MKILVKDGAGFIGSHLVDALILRGDEVVVVDDLSSGKKEQVNSKATFHQVDMTDPEALREVFNQAGSFDSVSHLAAQKSVTESVKNPVLDAEINILGTLNLLQLAVEFKVKDIIFSSTGGALYGSGVTLPATEDSPIAPLAPYGISKYATEHYLRFFQSQGLKTKVLRYANVYGPRQDPFGEAGVVAIFCQKLVEGQPLTVFGSGEQARDFVYVSDIVFANLQAQAYDQSGVWNIGTSQYVSVNSLVEQLTTIASSEGYAPKEVVHAAPRAGEVDKISLDSSKAKLDLSWQPEVSFDQGLKETFVSFER